MEPYINIITLTGQHNSKLQDIIRKTEYQDKLVIRQDAWEDSLGQLIIMAAGHKYIVRSPDLQGQVLSELESISSCLENLEKALSGTESEMAELNKNKNLPNIETTYTELRTHINKINGIHGQGKKAQLEQN